MSDDVTRYRAGGLVYRSDVHPDEELVLASDYDALAAKLREAEAALGLIARGYDDDKSTGEMATMAYDMACVAREALEMVRAKEPPR